MDSQCVYRCFRMLGERLISCLLLEKTKVCSLHDVIMNNFAIKSCLDRETPIMEFPSVGII